MCYTIKGKKGGDIMNTKPYFEVQTVTVKGNKRMEHSENLDRIKLPFYCYYSQDGGAIKHLGVVDWINSKVGYVLLRHVRQYTGEVFEPKGAVGGRLKLKDLITDYQINTVKVKVIVYE